MARTMQDMILTKIPTYKIKSLGSVISKFQWWMYISINKVFLNNQKQRTYFPRKANFNIFHLKKKKKMHVKTKLHIPFNPQPENKWIYLYKTRYKRYVCVCV